MRTLLWLVAPALLVLIFASPFLFTTRLVRMALAHVFPRNDPTLGRAVLNFSGSLTLHNLILHDTGPSASSPLVTIDELRAEFDWTELPSRRLRSLEAHGVTLYARSNARSQLSLLDLILAHPATAQKSATAPFWIDSVNVNGRIHRETLTAFESTANPDGKLLLKMTTSGDRGNPSRTIHAEIGDVEQSNVPGPNAGSIPPARKSDKNFGMSAEIAAEPFASGTRVTVSRFAAKNAALAVDADSLRTLITAIPIELTGRIDAGLTSLSGFGVVDLPAAGAAKLNAKIELTKAYLRAPGGPRLSLNLDLASADANVDTPLPLGAATALTFDRLNASSSKFTIAAATLRHYLPAVPPEITGLLEISLGTLKASGGLKPNDAGRAQHLDASLSFDGVRIRVPAKSQPLANIGDLSGAVKIDTPLKLGPATAITVERLQMKNVNSSLDADAIRRYAPKIPADLRGSVDTSFDQLDLSGKIGATPAGGTAFSGNLRLQNFSAKAPAAGSNLFALDRLTLAAMIDSPIDHWTPAAVKIRDAITTIARLSYGINSVSNLDAAWHDDGELLACDRCAVEIFDGRINGTPAFDLITHEMPAHVLEIHGVDVHQALANVSPDHIDADGKASGVVHLALAREGNLSGDVDLAFDGPGLLKIGEIQEVKQMLVGNFGMDMANLAMRDLRHFPFKEGSLHLESAGENTLLKIKFVRQPKTAADAITPHKEIINGQEVLVGSLVVPTIDMTIPITGQSLAEILSIVSGIHPMIQTASEPNRN